MEKAWVEIASSDNEEDLQQAKAILEDASIPVKFSSRNELVSSGIIGTVSGPSKFLYVNKDDFNRARAELESTYLKQELPEGHYLPESTDAEICEILINETDWSPFDVAHARRIAAERGIDANAIEDNKERALKKYRSGKKAPNLMIIAGFLFAFGGGILGIGIGIALATGTTKTPHGTFHTYDPQSRKLGNVILIIGFTALVSSILSYLIIYRT